MNALTLNPLFFLVFMGSAALAAMLAVLASMSESHGAGWWLGGAIVYLAGPFAVTMFFNVPLNERFAAASLDAANSIWRAYIDRWLLWSHVRMVLGVHAVLLLATGFATGLAMVSPAESRTGLRE